MGHTGLHPGFRWDDGDPSDCDPIHPHLGTGLGLRAGHFAGASPRDLRPVRGVAFAACQAEEPTDRSTKALALRGGIYGYTGYHYYWISVDSLSRAHATCEARPARWSSVPKGTV